MKSVDFVQDLSRFALCIGPSGPVSPITHNLRYLLNLDAYLCQFMDASLYVASNGREAKNSFQIFSTKCGDSFYTNQAWRVNCVVLALRCQPECCGVACR